MHIYNRPRGRFALRGLTAYPVGLAVIAGCCTRATQRSSGRDSAPASDRQVEAATQKLVEGGPGGHLDYSPAVYELGDIGLPAIPATLPLVLSQDLMTRLRAESVLTIATSRMFGFREGAGWPSTDAQARHEALWHRLGDLGADDAIEARQRSVTLWRLWLAAGASTDWRPRGPSSLAAPEPRGQ
jgi:hypothetical protein